MPLTLSSCGRSWTWTSTTSSTSRACGMGRGPAARRDQPARARRCGAGAGRHDLQAESPFRARKIGAALVARTRPGIWKGRWPTSRGLAAAGLLLAGRTALGVLRLDPEPDRLAGGDGGGRLQDLSHPCCARPVRRPVAHAGDRAGWEHRNGQDRASGADGRGGRAGAGSGGDGEPSRLALRGAGRGAALAEGLRGGCWRWRWRGSIRRGGGGRGESSKIGSLALPPRLWRAMVAAPRLAVAAPLEERAAYLTRAYADLTADPAELEAVINRLRPLHPAERIEGWLALAAAGAFQPLAQDLMARHYDARYAKQRALTGAPEPVTVEARAWRPTPCGAGRATGGADRALVKERRMTSPETPCPGHGPRHPGLRRDGLLRGRLRHDETLSRVGSLLFLSGMSRRSAPRSPTRGGLGRT